MERKLKVVRSGRPRHPLVQQIESLGREWQVAQRNPDLLYDDFIDLGRRMMQASAAAASALKAAGVCGDCRERKAPEDFAEGELVCKECVAAGDELLASVADDPD
jgi:hypothetical protein